MVGGGQSTGTGLMIDWQADPPAAAEQPQGATLEDVLEAVKARLQFLQQSPRATREYALALTKVQEALHWLDEYADLQELARSG